MRYLLATTLILLSGSSLAQAITTGPGGGSDSLAHAGQDVTVRSVTTTAASGSVAYRALPGSKVCLDGTTGAACLSSSSGSLVSGVNLSTPKVTATTASGSVAVEVPSGAKTCYDGSTGVACLTYNTGSSALEAGRKVTAPKFTATATFGDVGMELQSGSLLCLDGSIGATCLSDQSGVILMDTAIQTQSITIDSLDTNVVTIPSNSRICLNGPTCTQYITYNTVDGLIQVSSLKSLSGAITASTIVATVGVQLTPTGLGSCSAGIANQIRADSSSGSSPMRLCYCRSMGDGSYQWKNLLNPSATGSSSACPN